jgi:hypothetical protein
MLNKVHFAHISLFHERSCSNETFVLFSFLILIKSCLGFDLAISKIKLHTSVRLSFEIQIVQDNCRISKFQIK